MFFAVMREPGRSWISGLPLRQQPMWEEHAAFMNGLAEDRFVLLGGPLGESGSALLIFEAGSEDQIRVCLESDPWTTHEMLRITAFNTWQILLGEVLLGAFLRDKSKYFVVISEQGRNWAPGVPMREQRLWSEHASFMDGLTEDRFVLQGGPLGGTDNVHRALLTIDADSEELVRARLDRDPWTVDKILQIVAIHSWNIILGGPAR